MSHIMKGQLKVILISCFLQPDRSLHFNCKSDLEANKVEKDKEAGIMETSDCIIEGLYLGGIMAALNEKDLQVLSFKTIEVCKFYVYLIIIMISIENLETSFLCLCFRKDLAVL